MPSYYIIVIINFKNLFNIKFMVILLSILITFNTSTYDYFCMYQKCKKISQVKIVHHDDNYLTLR